MWRSVFVFLALIAVSTGIIFAPMEQSPCTKIISGYNHAHVPTNAVSNCTNGSLWWKSPQGELRVNFQYSGSTNPFSVCFLNIERGSILNIYELLQGGLRHTLTIPQPGSQSCTRKMSGSRTILFTGPSHPDHYMAFIDYYLAM